VCSVSRASPGARHLRDAEAQTIVENCGNTLILRCSASERGGTAEFASRLIGRREIIRRQVSHTRPTSLGGIAHLTQTTSDHHITEEAVMASEIEQLPDLAGFLKVASRPNGDASQWRAPENTSSVSAFCSATTRYCGPFSAEFERLVTQP